MPTPHLSVPSPAKLNLFLHVVGQRADGYHNIQTIFQLIDWCDILTFSPTQTAEINLQHDIGNLPLQDNLIFRAARLLQTHTQTSLGCLISLKKNLPIGGGLGGGSSNAATTLLTLNHLWGTQLSISELATLGAHLGADVPVFIHGNNAWADGIGDRLSPIKRPRRWYLVIHPRCHIDTRALFQHPELPRNHPKLPPQLDVPSNSTNHFAALACQLYPQVNEALSWLNQHKSARLSGTGSCVFAEFEQLEEANRVAQQVPTSWTCRVCAGINTSPTHSELKKTSTTL